MIRKTSPRDIRCKHVIQNRLPRCRHQTLFVLVVHKWDTVVYRLSYFKITFYVHSKHLTNLLSSTYDDHIFMYFQNGAGHTPAVSRRCRPHTGRLPAVPATPRPPSGGAGHTPAVSRRCRPHPGRPLAVPVTPRSRRYRPHPGRLAAVPLLHGWSPQLHCAGL